MSLTTGFLRERQACEYLTAQGLKRITNNYRTRIGEIDLIMQDRNGCLVFVEVRARASAAFGDGVTSVTAVKRQKIMKSALIYMQSHKLLDRQPVRFDIVSFDGNPPVITWIQDAFGMEYY